MRRFGFIVFSTLSLGALLYALLSVIKFMAFLSILSAMAFCAYGANPGFLSFDSLPEDKQEYVVKSLASALPTADVAVLHSRIDEIYRNDGEMDGMVNAALGLWSIRFPVILKGRNSLPPYSVGYIYKPDLYVPGLLPHVHESRPSGRDLRAEGYWVRPPYFPTINPKDDLTRLVLLTRQTAPLKDRIIPRNNWGARFKMIYEDATNMEATAFMEKYDLTAVFSNQVYSVVEGCIFHVDLPVPELPEPILIKENAAMLAADKARLPFHQQRSGLIHLSPEEVSEIVYIACLLDVGAGQYAEASKRAPELLLPVEKPEFKTAIGKRVHAAVAGKIPGTNTGKQGKQ